MPRLRQPAVPPRQPAEPPRQPAEPPKQPAEPPKQPASSANALSLVGGAVEVRIHRLTRAELFDAARLEQPNLSEKDALGILREALQHGRTMLTEHHLQGGSAATLVKYHSWLIDQILLGIERRASADYAESAFGALVAVGGYGRRELNLESDIDLLLLLPREADRQTEEAIESLIRCCWDLGLKIGHSVRTVSQCVEQASGDLSVMTNLLEARLIGGDGALFEQLRQALRDPGVWPSDAYFTAKLQEQEARHLRYGDTAYNLEPNLKESPGGLRDLQMISWVTNRYFGAGNLAELVEHRFLTPLEYRGLIRGRNFLWWLRNGLHLLSGRCEDRLLFDYQRELASQLGYRQGENHLAVELMMKRYYRTVKELRLLNELLLQHFQEAILAPQKPRAAKINARFRVVGDFLEAADDEVFQRSPGAILEMFHLLQQRPQLKGVRASTIRQLCANLRLIDDDYRAHPANRELFLEIFRYQEGLTHALRRMNRYGVLGEFFPEFGEIIGLMQHDLFHTYTVDAHSLFVVRNLRRLMAERHRHEFPLLSDLLHRQTKRELLFLAALCHDLGKGSGRDHSVVGEQIALALCARLGLSEYDARFVGWLVRKHLIMSWTAQREDVSDPGVIDRFAEVVGDQKHLDNLYLLTVADIRGTSPKVWTEWKGQLLAGLYASTSRRLRTGIAGAEAVSQRIEERKAATRQLVAGKVPPDDLETWWGQLGQEYFLRNGPETGAWHAEQITRAGLLDLPLVAARYRIEIAAQQILVLAPESENLLPRVTGALDKLQLDIVDARIHQTRSGLALLVFIAVDAAADGAPPSEKTIADNSEKLKDFVLSPPPNYRPGSRILSRALKQFSVPTTVTFDEPGERPAERQYTAMEVVAQDRPGLLYHVSLALLECKVKLISAKVSTVGEKAEDTFFITDRDGAPVDSAEMRDCLSRRLDRYLPPLGER